MNYHLEVYQGWKAITMYAKYSYGIVNALKKYNFMASFISSQK